MSNLAWYWHRLRAMGPGEVAGHLRKKIRQFVDARRTFRLEGVRLEPGAVFPQCSSPAQAPEALREALRREAREIAAGRWKAFGHLELKVEGPPRWHCDYLAGLDLATSDSAFGLNHRQLPEGADIKLIWELSRWHPLVRLAQAAYVLGDDTSARTCLSWLEDWVQHNPPYCGWNWTSALEVGMRLVQFTWIDALLAAQPRTGGDDRLRRLDKLRREILPPHTAYAWRHRSFGSSANNHLLGELAGLILAVRRWPDLARWGAPLRRLQRFWEREVLAQFAEDGGNREQALNYHLFSWELCWQARLALLAAGRTLAPAVEERLGRAARFFWEVQARREPWDYGDSDNACVTPFFTREEDALREWRDWVRSAPGRTAIAYWLGDPPVFEKPPGIGPPLHARQVSDWWFFEQTGIAVCESGFWWLRWDMSPLGYLRTAAHGHLDALHLSIWFNGVAVVIDPGTGAYYPDPDLRAWLASRAAHNGPCPAGLDYPKRLGPFLWSEAHARPILSSRPEGACGQVDLPDGRLRRSIRPTPDRLGWWVEDAWDPTSTTASREFSVCWQFAPGTWIKSLAPRLFSVKRSNVGLNLAVGEEWTDLTLVESPPAGFHPEPRAIRGEESMAGSVSPAFRWVTWAPYLRLTARSGEKPCVFRTAFLASPDS